MNIYEIIFLISAIIAIFSKKNENDALFYGIFGIFIFLASIIMSYTILIIPAIMFVIAGFANVLKETRQKF